MKDNGTGYHDGVNRQEEGVVIMVFGGLRSFDRIRRRMIYIYDRSSK